VEVHASASLLDAVLGRKLVRMPASKSPHQVCGDGSHGIEVFLPGERNHYVKPRGAGRLQERRHVELLEQLAALERGRPCLREISGRRIEIDDEEVRAVDAVGRAQPWMQ